MGKVLGVGGIFFKCKDPDATRAWYRDVLGMRIDDFGGTMFSQAAVAKTFPNAGMTIWSPFEATSDYFGPSGSPFMVNLMVDDLDAVLDRAQKQGVEQVKPRESEPYGHFAWIEDPDGRRLELWQPVEPPAGSAPSPTAG